MDKKNVNEMEPAPGDPKMGIESFKLIERIRINGEHEITQSELKGLVLQKNEKMNELKRLEQKKTEAEKKRGVNY